MATLSGWKIDYDSNLAGTVATDVTIGQVLAEPTEDNFAVGGVGDVPRGVTFKTIDISEDGDDIAVMTKGTAVIPIGAAIVNMNLPVKLGANGTVVPCSANNDIIVGMPGRLESSVGNVIPVELAIGGFYGV